MLDCTNHTLRAELGSTTLERGLTYARQRRVQTITSDGLTLIATVTGSQRRTYQATISGRQLGGSRTSISGLCSCPMQAGCKHVAAALVVARDLSVATATPAVPRWEKQLADLLAPVQQQQELVLGLQLQVDVTPAHYGTPEPIVKLRPVTPGKTGKWVKNGVSWSDVDYGYRAPAMRPEHREALRQMLVTFRAAQPYYSGYGETRMTLKELGPAAWGLLERAQQSGIHLVSSHAAQQVTLTEPAEVVVDVAHPPGSTVRVQPLIRNADGSSLVVSAVSLVGSPAHGAFCEDAGTLTLIPFAKALDKAVHAIVEAGMLSIPDEEFPTFLAKYYPALRQRISVASLDSTVELPEIKPPHLLLDVVFGEQHVTDVSWCIAYPIGDHVVRVHGPDAPVARDVRAEKALLDVLPEVVGIRTDPQGGRYLEPTTRLTGMGTALFIRDDLPMLRALDGLVIEVTGEPAPYEESEEAPLISVATSDSALADWFDLDIAISVSGQDVPMTTLITALALEEPQLLLPSGTWFRLDRPELSALRRIVEEARALQDNESDGLRLSPFHAGLWEELVELGVVARQSARWTATVGSLLALEELPRPALPGSLSAKLRPYQVEGYHWLSLLWDHQLGGILADDMGLGKTVQALAMAARAHEQGSLGGTAGPLLVVAPTSVVGNWASEAQKFAPNLRVVSITETAARSRRALGELVEGADLVVTSYALFRIDNEAYESLTWAGLLLDEAQFVKNHQALTYQCARRLPAPFKLAITGTPLENSLMDLWSMLSITAPGLFPSPQRFTELYRRPIESGTDPEMLTALRRRIRPLILRRTKELVAKDLPPKIEQVLSIPLNPAHRKVYDKHLARERQRVLGLLEDLQKNRITILSALTTLRQLSLDASLVDAGHAGKIASSKIDALMEQLPEVISEGHRVLVFSQFTSYLAIIRARLTAEGIDYVYLDGRTRNRPARIAEFTEGDAPVFLISLKAGGVGLTLTQADYVYVLDPWWNPAVEAQAVDRTHRIGQDKTVMVYRLVAQDTIEEKVVALQQKKRDLFAQVVDNEAMTGSVLTAEDIRGLFT